MLVADEQRLQDLSRAARMLAVIGAALKLRGSQGIAQPVLDEIHAGAELALGHSLDAIDDPLAERLLIAIDMAFAESSELLHHPDRAAGWKVQDAGLLQSQGRASGRAFGRIRALAASRPLLREALNGRFLDVGTGVGGIALEAASSCPDLLVDGIDVWKPALDLAESNVAASSFADRITITKLDVRKLKAGARYSLVWLPSMFMDRQTVAEGMDRIVAASRSAAYLIAPVYTRPSDPFMASVTSLRTLRSGGEIVEPSELEAMFLARGYVDVETDVTPLATFVVGRRP